MTTVVDTSALIEVVLKQPLAERCAAVLRGGGELLISAGTLAEALVVAGRKGIGPALSLLLDGLRAQVVPVTGDTAARVGEAYSRWGRGVHPAGLNFGDCFAYALARERGLPLLFVGEDFARTDVLQALGR